MTKLEHAENATDTSEPQGTIYFDGGCGMCTAGAARMQRGFARRGFAMMPLQTPGVAEMLALDPGELPDEMKLRTRDGKILGGVDALLHLAKHVWWIRPLRAVRLIPGGMLIARSIYSGVARNRYRISKACRLEDVRAGKPGVVA